MAEQSVRIEPTPAEGAAVPRERADVVRNRNRVLSAAEEVFARSDPRTVTMEDIARAAGVGRATLYRRFPDRASIARALLDRHEHALQEQLISGDPPLGPGAPPAERLAAFYEAMIGLLERHAPLVLGAEAGPERFTTGAYGFWRVHVRSLLTAAGHPEPDALVEPLLAPLAAEAYLHQRTERGLGPDRIAAGLADLAARVLAPAPD